MYAPLEKTKDIFSPVRGMNQTPKNIVAQKKSNEKRRFGLENYGPEAIIQMRVLKKETTKTKKRLLRHQSNKNEPTKTR